MRAAGIVLLAGLSAGLCFACGDPIVMLPGGELSGTVKPVPSDWSFSDAVEEVQLETRPDDPYSVNIWGVAVGERFYIASGDGMEAAWAQHIAEDPRVRLRIGEDLDELRAKRARTPRDRDAFRAAAKKKYDFEPDEEQERDAVIYRLYAR